MTIARATELLYEYRSVLAAVMVAGFIFTGVYLHWIKPEESTSESDDE